MDNSAKKTDLRITKTYAALENAFISLMEEKSFDDISVQELCDLALIRRTTFYKHFSDKYEYLDFFIQNIRNELVQENLPLNGASQEEYYKITSEKIIEWFKKNEVIVRRVLQSNGKSLLKQMVEELIYNDMLSLLKQAEVGSIIKPEIYASFISGGMIQVVQRWIIGEIDVAEEELACEMKKMMIFVR